MQQLAKLLEEPRLTMLLTLLKEGANVLGICKDILSHARIRSAISAYVTRYPTLQISRNKLSEEERKRMLIKKTSVVTACSC